jgi:hypothetical protein
MPRDRAAGVNATPPGSHGALAARRRNASADRDRFESRCGVWIASTVRRTRRWNWTTRGQTRVLLSGLGVGESPRWHQGRLWLSNGGSNEIVAADLNGDSEFMGRGGGRSGWAAKWLPDGRTLVTGDELIRVKRDGSRVQHADLSHISRKGWSEITVDDAATSTSTDQTSTSRSAMCIWSELGGPKWREGESGGAHAVLPH